MKPSTPKNESNSSNKALQKSMINFSQQLPSTYTHSIDLQALNSLKRSSIPMLESTFSTLTSTFQLNQNQSSLQQSKISKNINFGINYPTESRTQSHHEVLNLNGPSQGFQANQQISL